MPKGSFNPEKCFLGQNICPVAVQRHTDRHTEDTLSGFQDCFIQPIIKDRPNNNQQGKTQP